MNHCNNTGRTWSPFHW